MSFDSSRFTFNAWNDYLGVQMQQGRVQLDSDWNEWLAEFARRIQAGTLDILGVAGVPSCTPFAFKINAYLDAAGNHITIGAGRMYVDGMLIENWGPVGRAQWDRCLAEWSGAPQGATEVDVDYTSQPYLPGATIPPGNGPFLVYLDVWQREVTYLEDPDLVDKAVGIDTTGRLQTVWQVKLLDVSSVVGGVTCTTPDSAIQSATVNWGATCQPPSSLLITGVVSLPSSGPCALTPPTGYTGLENQLYRVEVHQGGSATSTPQASFKWSREDAAVTTGVSAISTVTNSVGVTASQLTVQSMGRDQVLGFAPGNWIEIIDDFLELNQVQAGELHKIDSVNPAARTITLDSTVSSTSFPVDGANQTNPARHTRIRRWDQAGTVYAYQGGAASFWVDLDTSGSSAIPVPPPDTPLILENGITVAFEGSSFRTGDFWLFAARTADGSVETFNQPAAAQAQPNAPIWNAATAYTPGQIVASAGVYFVCLAANTSQAPPNAAFWAPQTPPFGIHHHYRRLGTVDFTAKPPKVTDCRQIFQPLANPCIHVTNVLLAANPLLNDSTVTVQSLVNGITVVCDVPIDSAIITQPFAQPQSAPAWNAANNYTAGQTVTLGGNVYICTAPNTNKTPPNSAFWAVAQFNCPICYVTLELPMPASPPIGAYNPIILSATVSVPSNTPNTLNWVPTPAAQTTLLNQITPGAPPLLARLTLKGNFIWSRDNPAVYLNGTALGVLNTRTGPQANLRLPTGDGRRYADFEMWFWLVSQPAVTLSATSINFSTPQTVGSASAPQSVTLTNNSATTALTFPGGINLTGTNAADFKLTNTCGTSVAAGASCTITVTFTPAAVGTRTAQVAISESADSNPLVITLTGTGIQPQVSALPANLVFPAQIVGTTSAAQTLTLTNPGSSQLTISGIAIEGTDYTLSSACGGSLQPNQQCTISIQFAPVAAGTRTAQLQVLSNAGNVVGGTLLVPLTGTGVAGAPGVSPSTASLAFGSVSIASSSAQAVTLTSTGNTPLSITLIEITGTNFTSFSQTNNCGGTLQPSQQCTITVVFKPLFVGALSAQLQIAHNAAGSPLVIPLSGTGFQPKNQVKDAKDTKGTTLEKIQKDTDTVFQTTRGQVQMASTTQFTGGSATKAAFITPEERPQIGPQG